MSKIVWAVHRYYPYPGGSENNVRNIAEAMVRLGHDVTVWAPTNQGDQNGVKVTDDPNIAFLDSSVDLLIIHGAGPGAQNFVINNLDTIHKAIGKSIYYIIKPEHTTIHVDALQKCKYVAASTSEDYDFVDRYGVRDKTINIRYGVNESEVIGQKNFRDKYNLPKDKKMFLSCGGYWYNKAMKELVADFKQANRDDAFLVTTGYHPDPNFIPENSDNVYNIVLPEVSDVYNAMADANYYVMHSFEEGYGIVLLEAMFNKLPWISRHIAAARLFEPEFGVTYKSSDEFINIVKNLDSYSWNVEAAYNMVKTSHTSTIAALDLLEVLK
jgi:glycosyltransferase involved in cell wall biosynthesis